MRILSNSAKYQLVVENEVRQHAQDAQGVLQGYVLKPQILLQFHQSGITGYEFECGYRHWGTRVVVDINGNTTSDPWGAHPDDRDGALDGRVYRGWDPRTQFSIIDTSTMAPEVREVVEAFFTEKPSDENYIVIQEQALTPPWPTYDSMHHNKIGPTAHDLGLVEEAIRYETATKNREVVVKSLRREHVKSVEEAEEDAALKVIVP